MLRAADYTAMGVDGNLMHLAVGRPCSDYPPPPPVDAKLKLANRRACVRARSHMCVCSGSTQKAHIGDGEDVGECGVPLAECDDVAADRHTHDTHSHAHVVHIRECLCIVRSRGALSKEPAGRTGDSFTIYCCKIVWHEHG